MTPAELKTLIKTRFDVKFTYSNIKTILLNASKAFYNKTSKLLTDDEYDALREFYEAEKGPLPVGAPVTVGATLELSHSYSDFAGTLSKCKNFKDVQEWARLKKVTNDIFVCSIKGDGHSITVEIVINDDDMPEIDKALTRGEDGVGKDLTAIFKANHKHFPTPQIPWDCAIGYEAIITYDNFEKLSEITKGKYKNPRSAIGGILSTKGQKYFEYLTFVPIRIKSKDVELTREQQFEFLTDLPNFGLFEFELCYLNQIEETYDRHQTARLSSKGAVNFMYDGLVIETFNEKNRKRLGYSTTEPNFATALKFAPSEKATKAKSVKWSAEGFSGRFTPVVHFTPVVINGNTYKQVSLANLARFEALDLHVDDDISFTLRHDTLGYVDKLDTSKNTGKSFTIPTHCPECKDALERDDTFLFCANPICKLNIVGSVYNFIVKTGVMNIGRETIKLLVEEEFITGIPSLFTMSFKKLHEANIPGLGKVSINNIKKEIEKVFSKPVPDYVFLGSLNIPKVSRSRSKLILQDVILDDILATAVVHYDKPQVMRKLVGKVHGIGDGIADNLTKYCFEMQWIISEILSHITIEASEKVEVAEDFIQLSFCHTGNAAPLKDRKAIAAFLESKGHKLVTGVTGKTNYLINNDETSTTDKNATASKLKIPIISVQAMIDMLN
jgi:DNA ligase (NAD+)